jgi:hypothetical protein
VGALLVGRLPTLLGDACGAAGAIVSRTPHDVLLSRAREYVQALAAATDANRTAHALRFEQCQQWLEDAVLDLEQAALTYADWHRSQR